MSDVHAQELESLVRDLHHTRDYATTMVAANRLRALLPQRLAQRE
jgi:hypothetical protein